MNLLCSVSLGRLQIQFFVLDTYWAAFGTVSLVPHYEWYDNRNNEARNHCWTLQPLLKKKKDEKHLRIKNANTDQFLSRLYMSEKQ